MIVNKIITGYVVQAYDVSTKKCVGQKFFGFTDVEWENIDRKRISPLIDEEPQSCDMIQPQLTLNKEIEACKENK